MSFDVTTLALAKSYTNQHGGSGGGGSVPKPLTYDYMPEGYPKKSVQTTTLLEEQEVAFSLSGTGAHVVRIPSGFTIVKGQTYTVNWDGTEYECVGSTLNSMPVLGNLSIAGAGDDTGEPFFYVYNIEGPLGQFATLDTSASHTISVKRIEKKVTPMAKEFLPAGVGGGQVQPDWNQNDSTATDYVKNRPFYTGDPVETVLVEESTVSFAPAEDGVYMGELKSTFSATAGETYKVSWDGTTYECTCVNFNSFTVIGNLSIMGLGSDTGEPFLVVVSNGRGIEIYTADTSASHTFSIGGFVPEVVKIDRKFLPAGVGTTALITYVSSTNTYSSDLSYDELHEILLDHRQVVLWEPEDNICSYLTKWAKKSNGDIILAFGGGRYSVLLHTDGTIGKYITS